MQNRTVAQQSVIITGGSSGLGYQCAKAIAQSDTSWYIIIAGRNIQKVETAVNKLVTETTNPNIQGVKLDLASLQSVLHFVKQLPQLNIPPLKGLVCNAGIQIVSGNTYTEDGFEETFGVNHLAHFLLVNLLLSHMTGESRIIFVSSDTHDPATKTGMPAPQYRPPNEMAFPGRSDEMDNVGHIGRRRYTTSKLCNLLCAYELARRLQNDERKIWVNAFNPGLMLDTQLTRNYNIKETLTFLLKNFWDFLPHILRFRNSKNMGKALAFLILNSDFNCVTGKYFDGFEQEKSSAESHDKYKAEELWNGSKILVGLEDSI